MKKKEKLKTISIAWRMRWTVLFLHKHNMRKPLLMSRSLKRLSVRPMFREVTN